MYDLSVRQLFVFMELQRVLIGGMSDLSSYKSAAERARMANV